MKVNAQRMIWQQNTDWIIQLHFVFIKYKWRCAVKLHQFKLVDEVWVRGQLAMLNENSVR